ncbi:hypothetical protein B0H14DRAFT_2514992 [Mycena olivaceomarginata]|nr:hypothetical protein B0H14DRAFT_2514992 [Mycena olivaceomarginata]
MTNTDDSRPPPAYDARNHNMSETKKDTGPELRYLYYRVYGPDGAIPSKTAFDPCDPFVGRITARSVPPPHNANSLKRRVVNVENFADPDGSRTVLYHHPDSMKPLQSSDKVTIGGPGPPLFGAAPKTAFALVFLEHLTADEDSAINSMHISGRREENPKYLYYRLFTQVGEDTSKLSFDDNEPALGRVESILVPLPHTYGAIKRYIAKVEGKPIYAYSELYENTLAEQAIDDNKYVFLGHEDTAGWTADKPMALVQPERRPGLLNRPVKVLSNARAKDFNFFGGPPSVGELGYSDGATVTRYFVSLLSEVKGHNCSFDNRSNTGFLSREDIVFLDE